MHSFTISERLIAAGKPLELKKLSEENANKGGFNQYDFDEKTLFLLAINLIEQIKEYFWGIREDLTHFIQAKETAQTITYEIFFASDIFKKYALQFKEEGNVHNYNNLTTANEHVQNSLDILHGINSLLSQKDQETQQKISETLNPNFPEYQFNQTMQISKATKKLYDTLEDAYEQLNVLKLNDLK